MADAVNFVADTVFDTEEDASPCPSYARYARKGLLSRFLRESDPLKAVLFWLQHIENRP